MPFSTQQRPSAGAATSVVLFISLPLMALVGAVFVGSHRQQNTSLVTERRDGNGSAVVAALPAVPAAVDEPSAQPIRADAKMEPLAQAPSASAKASAAAVVGKSVESPPTPPESRNQLRQDSKRAAVAGAPHGILIEELSKETYNALTELKAVVESQSWEEAAEIVASFGPATASGLAPYIDERELLTTLPVAIELAREDFPGLRQALREKLAPVAKLRIASAIRDADEAAIAFASVQFADSPTAAEAHRWLGDQALVAGRFTKALTEYERWRRLSSDPTDDVQERIRLAAAMLGHDVGTAVNRPVQFGDVTIPPGEFEALAAAIRRRGALAALVPAEAALTDVLKPTQFVSHVRSRLDGPVGERPQDDVGRETNQLRVPWVDRQIATAVEGDVMYVSNRFQVAAYRLTSGQRIWQSEPPPGGMQRSQDWGLISMRPLVVGNRVFARLLYSRSPLLVCLDRSSGRIEWVGETRENESLVSDPLLIDGQLIALAVAYQPEQNWVLRQCVIDPRTGETLREHDLVRLRKEWEDRACCEVAQTEDGLIAALGGVVLNLDVRGNVRWARTQATRSAAEDRRWVVQKFQRPLVQQGRLFVAQPGVKTVECLSTRTGRRYWSAALPNIEGIVGLAGETVLIQTRYGVSGLAIADGTTRWEFSSDDLFSFHLVNDERVLVAGREPAPDKSDRWQPRLLWVNPADGKTVETASLESLADSDPRLGPLVTYHDRVFAFFGRGQLDATRDIVELIPSGRAEIPALQP